MKKATKILFPTDFSHAAQNAFRYALLFADKLEASIEVLHVIYPDHEAIDAPMLVAQATEKRVEAAREAMKSFVGKGLTQVGQQIENLPDVQSDIEIGMAPRIIADIARRDESDFIIMGTKGEHNVLEKLLGSVTTAVLEKAHCPVLVIPEHAAYKKINVSAYATDLYKTDPYEIWKVSKWLAPFSSVMRCVHFNLDGNDEDAGKMEELESFFQDNPPALQISFHHLPGDNIEENVDDFVDVYGIDLMVMYKPNRSFFDRLFHPSQTKKVALTTVVPLFVLKEEK